MSDKNEYNGYELERSSDGKHYVKDDDNILEGLYDYDPFKILQGIVTPQKHIASLQTLDDLLERDEKREKDGFPRRIRLGKIAKKDQGGKDKVIIVPTTAEPKFYHDDSITKEEEESGGTGDGEEGEVIGEQPVQPQEGEGEGEGAGQGKGGGHDVTSDAFDLGKVLTEKFDLPNLQQKGSKKSLTKYTYDLTDKNRGFGQIIDKKATLRRIIQTNILLGRIKPGEEVKSDELIINPKDNVFRILSKEKDYETQAIVFFLRDYSGSMQGKPTESVVTQHLFIYSWLVYQYQNNVETRFILHDNEAKEVEDFHVYHNSTVAGGTNVFPAFELVNKIIREENLVRDYNIYVFYGTDGDDWDSDGRKMMEELKHTIGYANRVGITVARNSWSSSGNTIVERYLSRSGMLNEFRDKLRLDSFNAADSDENRLIEGIKKLVEEN
jgi:uncharacterized sporulation protein YeaH/YhbH (DUF444 family)